jgi:PAS domain S-box-containing protein
MKLLYLTGTEAEVDTVTTEQLSRIAPQVSVTTVASAAEALVEIRRLGGFHALLTSPTLARNETLALITSLRTDRVPIAIVPVVGETHQDFLASAIGAGADDVLVLRADTLVQPTETLTRIRQSPHLFPSDDRRLRVLYAGSDAVVWDLLEQLPFVRAEHAVCTVDGTCTVRSPGAADGSLRCDVVLIDEKPGEAHPLQVIKSVKAQASDLPVIVLSPTGTNDFSTAAFDLGADDAVQKTSAYRRRLVATLRRVHLRLELTAQHTSLRDREQRLRQIVETMPEGLTVISGDGTVLAMNAAGLMLVGATRPREVVGRDFNQLVVPDARSDVRQVLELITAGEPRSTTFDIEGIDGGVRRLELRGVRLERDARGGRGVIATIRPVGAGADEGLSGADAAGALEREQALESALSQAETRLRDLEKALREADQHRFQLDATLATERSRWDQERTALEVQSQEAMRIAAAQADAAGTVEAAHAELDRMRAQQEEERRQWEAARASLQSHLQEQTESLSRAKADLESALARTEDEHARQRAEWESARDGLQSQLQQHSDLAGREKSELESAVARIKEEQARERAEWESARAALQAQLQQHNDHAGREKSDLESALDATRRELAEQREAGERARAEWDEARRALENRVSEMRVAWDSARHDAEVRRQETQSRDADRAELQSALDAAHRELAEQRDANQRARAEWDEARQQIDGAHQRARAEWDEARKYLEVRCADLVAASAGQNDLREALERATVESDRRAADAQAARDERAELQATLEAAQGLLRQTTTEQKDERARWDAERRELESRANRLAETAQGHDAMAATLEGVRGELRQATQAAETERARAAEIAEARERDRAEWAQQQSGWEQERSAWERERANTRSERARIDEHRDAERGQIETLRTEMAQRDAAHTAERLAWDQKRRELEAKLSDIEAVAGMRLQLDATLEAVRAELRDVQARHASERAAWERAKVDVDRERKEAEAARLAEQHRTEAASRTVDELRSRLGALEQERAQTESARASLEKSLQELRAAQTEIASAKAAALREAADARHAVDQVRAELDQVQRKLDQEHTRRALLEAAVREARKDAEARLAAVEAEFAATRKSLESDLADSITRIEQVTQDAQATRTRLELEATAHAEGYDRLLGSALFGYAVTTTDGLLVRCNDTFARLFGYLNARDAQTRTAGRPFPALAGRSWLDARLAEDGRLDQFDSTLERIDGRTIRVIESAAIVTDASGQQVVERTLVDRTGTYAQDERLRQADRLEEIGTLVAAMAPDIESLLTSVATSGSALAEAMPPSDARREHTGRITSHASQAADLVRQLAAFSLKHVRPAEPLDLAEAVRRSERLLRPLLGPHVGLKLRLNRTDAVSVSQDDLDQLLSALTVAGRDLLPIGGTLAIETARVELDDAEADPAAGLKPGAHLQLAVVASGYGVQPAHRTASLDAVASRCGGHLRVAGEKGRSAALRVFFPRWPGLAGPMA